MYNELVFNDAVTFFSLNREAIEYLQKIFYEVNIVSTKIINDGFNDKLKVKAGQLLLAFSPAILDDKELLEMPEFKFGIKNKTFDSYLNYINEDIELDQSTGLYSIHIELVTMNHQLNDFLLRRLCNLAEYTFRSKVNFVKVTECQELAIYKNTDSPGIFYPIKYRTEVFIDPNYDTPLNISEIFYSDSRDQVLETLNKTFDTDIFKDYYTIREDFEFLVRRFIPTINIGEYYILVYEYSIS